MVSMEVTFPQEIEPSFLAVRLKKNTNSPGCPLAVFGPSPLPPPPPTYKFSNFICHQVCNIPH